MAKRNFKKKFSLFTSVDNMTIVTPSEWLASEVRQSFFGKYEVLSIPNGVDLSAFRPTSGDFRAKHGLENKKIVLGVATAWGPRKGLAEFIKLSKVLGQDHKVVLVGLTEEQIPSLPCEILALPRTNNLDELAEIYSAADVFVNLGKEETMGLTTVEAMACGTPALVSNLTAVPEVVSPSGGMVLENLETDTIAEGVRKILDGHFPNPRQDAERYEKNAQFAKYLNKYEEHFKKD